MKYLVLCLFISCLNAETNSTKKSYFTVEELSKLIENKEKVNKKYENKEKKSFFEKRTL